MRPARPVPLIEPVVRPEDDGRVAALDRREVDRCPVLPAPVSGVGRVGWWARLAVGAGRVAAHASTGLGLGRGSIIGGRVALLVHPGVLSSLSAGKTVVLVSGTNGKTTTSHLLAAALRTAGVVAHNASGANMADGAVAALAARPDARYAVLEVDELHLGAVADAVDPAVIVLLNLTRDQLDRAAEVRATAAKIGSVLAGHPRAVVVANADDPMTVWAAAPAPRPVWVGAGARWRGDTTTCPRCGHTFGDQAETSWCCTSCGLSRPQPSWSAHDTAPAHDATVRGPDGQFALSLRIPGRVNIGNAVMALAVAHALGVPTGAVLPALSALEQVGGRYVTLHHHRHTLRLLLAKNPAGWAEMLSLLTAAHPRPLLVAINAREADGRDTSWLWDVDFEALPARPIAASGERAADLGVRLSYAGLDHHTAPDPLQALRALAPGPVDVIANYTAFHHLLRRLHHAP